MKKAIVSIYEEDDYSRFKRLEDNRDVYESRARKLIASMSERYVLNPIVVNENMEIIDGQGRFEARKQMGLPIHYFVAEGATSDDCRRMNKYNTKWSMIDFAKSYVKAGNQNYTNLLETCEKTKMPLLRVLRLANRGSGAWKKDGMTVFERGDLTFTEEDCQTVFEVKKHADDVIEALQFTARPNNAFYTGLKICTETKGYNKKRMVEKCKKQRSSYVQMSSILNQLKEFERIYNCGLQYENRLYFSDYMRNKGNAVRDYSEKYSVYTEADISTLKK